MASVLVSETSQKAEKMITANPHTIDELITYMTEKYGAFEADHESKRFVEERKELKAALVERYKPELLGDDVKFDRLSELTEEELNDFMIKIDQRHERAVNISDELFQIDYHAYRIEDENHWQIEVQIEKLYQCVFISRLRSGGGRKRKTKIDLSKVVVDLYLYYGVSQADIDNRTERFNILVTTLATKSML